MNSMVNTIRRVQIVFTELRGKKLFHSLFAWPKTQKTIIYGYELNNDSY